MKSFFNRLCLSQTFRRAAVMLVVLACTSLTAQGQYKTIWFQGETTVSIFQQKYGIHAVTVKMVASAGTVLVFDNGGKPAAIGFAQEPKGIIQAEYGIDETGPKDKGRLIFKPANTNEAMPYFVIGEKDIFTYHLKYLELTTSGNDYSAYATKAIAFDNKGLHGVEWVNLGGGGSSDR
jgi:hypothetical protein